MGSPTPPRRGPAATPLRPKPPRRPRTALEFAILVIGGWVVTTIAQGLLNNALASRELAVALGSVLSLAWYALIAYEAYHWFVARRGPPLAAGPAVRALPGRPVFGIVSIGATVVVWIWVRTVFYGPIEGHGESAQIGLAAAGFLALVGLVAGLLSGIASFVRKEPQWLGVTGIGAALATAAFYYYKLSTL